MKSIFVSIASYRDLLLDTTIESLLTNQSNNNRIVISVLDQSFNECKYKDHPSVIYKQIPPEYSNGVGWARHVNSLNITDEDFYYQIDSHSVFDKNWDEYLINDFYTAADYYKTHKITLSNACKVFTVDEDSNVHKEHEYGFGYITVGFIKDYGCNGFDNFKLTMPHSNFSNAAPTTVTVEAKHLHGGNFFTHTDFIRHVGICPFMFFFGEEHYMTLNAFLNGYKLLHHPCVHIYHLKETRYYNSKVSVNPVISAERQGLLHSQSMHYWFKFLEQVPKEKLIEFYKYTGVDYINARLDNRACTTL